MSNFCSEFHKNPTNNSVADAASQTDGRKEAVHKAFWGQIKQHLNQKILYIKMNVCIYMYVPYTNSHFWADLNQTLHTSPPWSGRDRRVCMGPKFLTSSTFWTLFLWGATAESWAQDGCRRDRFPRYPYIRGSSWCSRDVTDITLSLTAESSATALYPWF